MQRATEPQHESDCRVIQGHGQSLQSEEFYLPMDLTNHVAIITGGKRIGRVVAGELAARGMDLVLSYRGSKEEALATVSDVEARGRKATTIVADVAKAADCEAIVAHAAQTFGRVDVLINMASIYVPVAFDTLTDLDWQRNLDINLKAAFLCAKAAVPHMRRQGGGRIINFADWLAASGRPQYTGFVPYYVATAGVIALTEALALELAADHILVNAIAPGPIVPPPELTEEERQTVAQRTPLGRWGGELEIAKAVLTFIESEFITGETLRVDGGRHVL
jgi:NAD(P)-dependent dehydrogenase (short-subunit alcohol dehydrogenase family)